MFQCCSFRSSHPCLLSQCPEDGFIHLFFFFYDIHFLVLSCMNCLYILEINYLSFVSIAIIILSHSEGCLSPLLILFFIVQKCLTLIWSHLFICVLFPLLWEVGYRESCCDLCQTCLPMFSSKSLYYLVLHLGL